MDGFYDVDGVIRGIRKLREARIKFEAAVKGEDPEAAFLESLTFWPSNDNEGGHQQGEAE